MLFTFHSLHERHGIRWTSSSNELAATPQVPGLRRILLMHPGWGNCSVLTSKELVLAEACACSFKLISTWEGFFDWAEIDGPCVSLVSVCFRVIPSLYKVALSSALSCLVLSIWLKRKPREITTWFILKSHTLYPDDSAVYLIIMAAQARLLSFPFLLSDDNLFQQRLQNIRKCPTIGYLAFHSSKSVFLEPRAFVVTQ